MPIVFDEPSRRWALHGRDLTYALGIDARGRVQHLHFGAPLPDPIDLPPPDGRHEYPCWGGLFYDEPALKATFADHVREVTPVYQGHQLEADLLVVTMRDSHYPLAIRLHYRLFEDEGLVERWAEIENAGTDPVVLEQVLSATWSLPRGDAYRLTHLAGKWGAETQVYQDRLTPGKKILESRRGQTSHGANPWFAIDRGAAAEDEGTVWFGALAWSGSWKIVVECTPDGATQVSGGIHAFDFAWRLEGGSTFTTPVFVAGHTSGGFGQASRNLHRYQRRHVLPRPLASRPRPVLYNSWEATGFAVTEENQSRLAERAAAVGVELFVMDDGWFGAREDDRAGLGDWVVNPRKFPNGLRPLTDRVHALGMQFGLWVEPEMVNPDSDFYRAHPDWVYHFPNRPRSESRNQLVLNLARPDVQRHLFETLHRLLAEHDIAFLKWDMNRPISEPGWPEAAPEVHREVWVRHVWALYELLARLRTAHPGLAIESCAGGGGRVDLGILRLVDQVWTSDNTDPLDRLKIQEGFSLAYCPRAMMCWVTDSGRWVANRPTSLAYRFHSAMMGSLGIGGNLLEWSADDLEEARRWVEAYKAVRHLVQDGDQYRLLTPRAGDTTAVAYVSPDRTEAVVFALRDPHQFGNPAPRLHLRGLREDLRYQVTGLQERLSGRALMSLGLELPLAGDLSSLMLKITAVAAS